MAGGEFCGNAAASLACHLVHRRGMKRATVPLEISGAEGVVQCGVLQSDGSFLATLNMPLPETVTQVELPLGPGKKLFTAVHLPGIVHVIAPAGSMGGSPREAAAEALRTLCEISDAPACGVILLSESDDENSCRIEPLVRVRGGVAMWERGCGSGSAAVGAFLADRRRRRVECRVSQPGGVMTVEAEFDLGAVSSLSITGTVRIVARGVAYV
jgi:diaminopimelate epimerase